MISSRLPNHTDISSITAKVLAVAIVGGLTSAAPAKAASDCAVYTATMKVGGVVQRVFTTPVQVKFTPPPGAKLEVRGRFTEFDVALDTLAVFNHVLTGVAAPNQITPNRTRLFDRKVSNIGTLQGEIDLELDNSGQNLVMRRRGSGEKSVKIQAKDCDQGGIFQLEPEPSASEFNALAAGFRYCFQSGPTGKRFFTNNIVLGYDSPQAARTVNGTASTALWQVQDGGRVGAVLGEDALQALIDEGPAAVAACPNQTP
jgi:hypothetical protein